MTQTEIVPAGAQRVSDADRHRVASLLADACADGLIGLDEIDDRLSAAFAARTAGELATATVDLPPDWQRARRRAGTVQRAQAEARAALGWHVASYAAVMLLLVGIWLSVGLAAGAWYPWPIWPALGWGIGVWSHARAATGRPTAPRLCGSR